MILQTPLNELKENVKETDGEDEEEYSEVNEQQQEQAEKSDTEYDQDAGFEQEEQPTA